jgi:hypothetical protein
VRRVPLVAPRVKGKGLETIQTETVHYLGINSSETPESDPGDRTRAGSAPTRARYQLGYEPVLCLSFVYIYIGPVRQAVFLVYKPAVADLL